MFETVAICAVTLIVALVAQAISHARERNRD